MGVEKMIPVPPRPCKNITVRLGLATSFKTVVGKLMSQIINKIKNTHKSMAGWMFEQNL
jgi:hypothetical protein